MQFFNRLIVFIPLSVHIAYAAATIDRLPSHLGRTVESTGTDTLTCLVVWFSLVGLCNAAFLFLHIRMPHFKDAALRLPGIKIDLTAPDTRADYVSRLRAAAETSLLSLNVFFLAVYQGVYQANALHPVLQFPRGVLFVAFMIGPLLLVVFHVALTVHRLKNESADPSDL